MASATKDACCLVCVQRMLAHRVGQHYGLQTSTVDYEECNGRVIGVRTKYTMAPKVGNWRKHQLWPRFCGAWEAFQTGLFVAGVQPVNRFLCIKTGP